MDIFMIAFIAVSALLLGFMAWLGITATMPPREDIHVKEVRLRHQREEAMERELQRHLQAMARIKSTRFKARK
jgi:hypothetical protein